MFTPSMNLIRSLTLNIIQVIKHFIWAIISVYYLDYDVLSYINKNKHCITFGDSFVM